MISDVPILLHTISEYLSVGDQESACRQLELVRTELAPSFPLPVPEFPEAVLPHVTAAIDALKEGQMEIARDHVRRAIKATRGKMAAG